MIRKNISNSNFLTQKQTNLIPHSIISKQKDHQVPALEVSKQTFSLSLTKAHRSTCQVGPQPCKWTRYENLHRGTSWCALNPSQDLGWQENLILRGVEVDGHGSESFLHSQVSWWYTTSQRKEKSGRHCSYTAKYSSPWFTKVSLILGWKSNPPKDLQTS